jgi:hypothetical protein
MTHNIMSQVFQPKVFEAKVFEAKGIRSKGIRRSKVFEASEAKVFEGQRYWNRGRLRMRVVLHVLFNSAVYFNNKRTAVLSSYV